jgi:hypothetical protein
MIYLQINIYIFKLCENDLNHTVQKTSQIANNKDIENFLISTKNIRSNLKINLQSQLMNNSSQKLQKSKENKFTFFFLPKKSNNKIPKGKK